MADRSASGHRWRGAVRAAGLAILLISGACGAPLTDESVGLDRFAACWTDFNDPLNQVLCFTRGSDVVRVERGGAVSCNAEGQAAIVESRLVVVQETKPAGCADGTPFIGQFVECDLTNSTLDGIFCKRRLGDAVDDPNAGQQYILTRL